MRAKLSNLKPEPQPLRCTSSDRKFSRRKPCTGKTPFPIHKTFFCLDRNEWFQILAAHLASKSDYRSGQEVVMDILPTIILNTISS